MQLIPPGTRFDFVGFRKVAFALSGLLIAIGMASIVSRGGLNYGIDFAGGVLVHLRLPQPRPISDIRGALRAIDLGESAIQDFGTSGNEFLVRLPVEASSSAPEDRTQALIAALEQKFGKNAFEILRIEQVGPRVGRELRQKAILAVLFSTAMMGIYLWFRFELRFGVGAAVALLHDVLVTIGALSLANFEFDLTIVAGLLTVVGFSVNDTVIVSDRIRENMRRSRREALAEIVNRSINETLSRTILTTGTAVLVIVALLLFGGSVIRGFAFTLLIGFLVGTYSSIYIASPVVLLLEGSRAVRVRR